MTGLDTDLATLRRIVNEHRGRADGKPALDRAEAEIARLNRVADNLVIAADVEKEKREAAERELAAMSRRNEWLAAKVARLQEGLREYADIRHWRIQNDGFHYPLIIWIGPGATDGKGGTQIAQALLAEDGAADICPECGSGILNGEHIANYPCSRRAEP